MNSITISGRIGRDAELRKTQGGTSVCSFALACNRQKKDDKPDWFDITLWGDRAEKLAAHLKKGVPVVVVGRLELQTYAKNDGTQGSKLAVNCNDIAFSGSTGKSEEQKPVAPPPPPPKPAEDLDAIFACDQEIPF